MTVEKFKRAQEITNRCEHIDSALQELDNWNLEKASEYGNYSLQRWNSSTGNYNYVTLSTPQMVERVKQLLTQLLTEEFDLLNKEFDSL